MSTDGQWLNVHDIASLLQIKNETVRRWIRRGELAVLDLGGPRAGYRVRREDLDHFIWQRYRMRNQQQEDKDFRLEFSQSEERVRGGRSVRIISDESGSVAASDTAERADETPSQAANVDTRYLSLISRIPGITYIASANSQSDSALKLKIAFVSEEFERILGITAAQLRANADLWWNRVLEDDIERVREDHRERYLAGNRLSLEYRIVDCNQQVCWVREEAVISEEADNGQALWQGIILNVSDRKSIEEALKARSNQQTVITELGDRALNEQDLAKLMDEAVLFVQRSLNVDLTKVLQLQPGGEKLLIRAGAGWKRGIVNRVSVSAGAESQAGYTLLSNEPVIVSDLLAETRFNGPPLLRDYGVRSGISVIIAGNGMPWGVLGAHSTSLRSFTREDVNFLQSVANILASAIRAEARDLHDGRWLSIKNVAETLRVKEETVRRWIRRGELPVIDLGSSRAGYRIHPSDLEHFIGDRYMGRDPHMTHN